MRIAVLGLGNVLMGDDGLGPCVIQHLQAAYDFPASVAVEDLGTPGLDLIPFLADTDVVIFVDTVRSKGKPGELRLYRTDEILRHAPNPRLTPHDPGVKSALLTLRLAGMGPAEATLVGIIPGCVEKSTRLSTPVRAAVHTAAEVVLDELSRLGVAARRREHAEETMPWWAYPCA